MKKSKKTAMIAAAFAVAMGISSCFPNEEEIPVRTKGDSEIETENPEAVYGPPPDIYDPDDEPPTEVYGPPEDFE